MKKHFNYLFFLIMIIFLTGCASQTTKDQNTNTEEQAEASTVIDVNIDELLPIGTVVKLKGMEKQVMIYGRYQTQLSSNRTYDYLGVSYPEGNISEDYNVFFNRTLIEEVLHLGFETDEELELRKQIEAEIEKGQQPQ